MLRDFSRVLRSTNLFALSVAAVLLAPARLTALGQTPAADPGTSTAIAPNTEGWIDALGDVDMAAVLGSLDPDVRAYIAHDTTLANPFFEGRAPGTNGNRAAAQYIEFWFKHYGLQPAFPEYDSAGNALGDGSMWVSYRQPFDIPAIGESETTRAELSLDDATGQRTTYEAGKDFVALSEGEVTGPLTFVGYGIASGPGGQNHYGDADLKGRIAVMLRFEPSDAAGQSKWNGGKSGWSANASIETKVIEAAGHGAAGVILMTPPDTVDRQAYEMMSLQEVSWQKAGVPVVQMSAAAAERLLELVAGQSLAELKKAADDDAFVARPIGDGFAISMAGAIGPRQAKTDNVGGVIRGRGELKDQWIIIGAHYDHVGYGFFGSNSGREARGVVHPGADDNASGTSAVLILAGRLSKVYAELPEDANARSILLMTFSAEESGLNGSRHYTKHPTLAADQVNIMLNLDMMGRLRKNSLEVSGVGSAAQLEEIVRPYFEKSGMRVVSQQTGGGPSDHASFNAVGIPVLFFFTGLHGQYHRPADVASLINPVGAIKIVDLAQKIAMEFAQRPEKLKHQQTEGGFRLDMLDQPIGAAEPAAAPATPIAKVRVRLGIKSDGEFKGTGVRLLDVTEDAPAQSAGLQAGDVILSWNGAPVANITALMAELVKHNPGDVVKLGVKRGGEMRQIPVTLTAANSNDG